MSTGPDIPALADELHLVIGALVRQSRAVSPDRDITLGQVSILKRLDREGPHAVADLARLDKISHQSVTVSVAALVERDLVRRTPDPHDGRRKVLELTAAGRRLLTERREAGQERLAEAISRELNPAEQARLAEVVPLLQRLLT